MLKVANGFSGHGLWYAQAAEEKNRVLSTKKKQAEEHASMLSSEKAALDVKHQALLLQCDKLMSLVQLVGTYADTDFESAAMSETTSVVSASTGTFTPFDTGAKSLSVCLSVCI